MDEADEMSKKGMHFSRQRRFCGPRSKVTRARRNEKNHREGQNEMDNMELQEIV